ncbi:hypothetical protein QR680_009470 [Steinernema hermaphroditum]|uniref:Charged multivesicular body protein 6 n=1 Tax=Steinernema hermaphroditum TaxID=289476 RepID=A0AA39M9Z1_9BILA|nr:hypothetical protein QR680_009470 [Steinernema hermaphroditum]
MGSLFSKKKDAGHSLQSRVTEKDQVILQLKTQRDKMKIYVKKNQKTMEKDREVARQLLKVGKKDRALILLKKKKYVDQMVEKTLRQLNQIESMVQDLEFAEIEQRVLEGLKKGNESLKEMNKMFSIEDVEKIMDDTREAAEYQEEISNLIAGGLSQNDLADVEEEFEKLMETELPQLPEVPSEEPVVSEAERERPVREKARREKVLVTAE